jgi:hypothetical protein
MSDAAFQVTDFDIQVSLHLWSPLCAGHTGGS